MTTQERGSVALDRWTADLRVLCGNGRCGGGASPYRAASGVRRGVRHNSFRRADGLWAWRYDLFGPVLRGKRLVRLRPPVGGRAARLPFRPCSSEGGESKFVTDDDVAEFRRRLPSVRYEVVDGAGHAVQSDRPLQLVRLIEDFAFEG